MTQTSSKKLIIGAVLLLALFLIVLSMPRANAQGTSETVFPSPRAVEANEWQPHFGVRGGYSNPDDNFNGAAEYGLEAGFQPYVPFGVGLEFTRSVSESSVSKPDLERTAVLAKGTYNFGGTLPIIRTSFLGLGLGPVFDHNDNKDSTRLGFNLLGGFDIPLDEQMGLGPNSFSLGAVANYLFVSTDGPDTLGLNGTLKYWF
ncbi:MAG: hypothetical protein AB7F59_03485 [Bdellovibrionales bacterium]